MTWIRVYEDALTMTLCKELIELFENSPDKSKIDDDWRRCHQLVHVQNTPLGEAVRASMRELFDRYKADVRCGTLNFVGRLEAPSLFRYDVSDPSGIHHFHSHADQWSMHTASRQISIIAYLNHVQEGGETIFDANPSGREERIIVPRTGRALIFPSSFCYQHRGEAPKSGPKYVLVAWLHFDGTGHAYTTVPLY
jgi:hypothetical protein